MSFEDDMKLINAAREQMNAIELPPEAARQRGESSVLEIDARRTRELMESEKQQQWLRSVPCSKEIN